MSSKDKSKKSKIAVSAALRHNMDQKNQKHVIIQSIFVLYQASVIYNFILISESKLYEAQTIFNTDLKV